MVDGQPLPVAGRLPGPTSRSTAVAAIGARVRAIRTERGLSLSALAEAAGVGKGSLSELESGRRNPTLATLYALAGPLGVPLTTLLADRPGAVIAADGLTAVLVSTERTDAAVVEVYRVELTSLADRLSPAHGEGVVEHLLLLEGRLEITHHAGAVQLEPGESVDVRSDGPHRYRALGEACRAVLVITTPARHGGQPGRR